MKFVRIFAAVLAVAAMVSLCSCGGGNDAAETTTTADALTTADPSEAKILINFAFVEVDSATGSEKNLFGLDGFEVAGMPGKTTVLDALKQIMAEFGFAYTLNSTETAMFKGMNLENTADKYWTCVVDEGESLIEVYKLDNAFNAAYIGDGDTVVFKYMDRP